MRATPYSFSRQLQLFAQEHPDQGILLFVDQFEELYTLSPADQRGSFLDLLLTALEEQTSQHDPILTVVFTLRADFFSFIISEPRLLDLINQHKEQQLLMLGAMRPAELQAAIEEPAKLLGVPIEDGLTGRILKDVSERPGDLPLLEFALTLLWNTRFQHAGKLTHVAYNAIGGVEQALAKYADEVYADLTEEEKTQAEYIFTQLVSPGEGTEDTRRLATDTELGDQYWPLVTWLASKRLVVTGYAEADGQKTVEVVHEALISRWQNLRGWMGSVRSFRSWQERLRLGVARTSGDLATLRKFSLLQSPFFLGIYKGHPSLSPK